MKHFINVWPILRQIKHLPCFVVVVNTRLLCTAIIEAYCVQQSLKRSPLQNTQGQISSLDGIPLMKNTSVFKNVFLKLS